MIEETKELTKKLTKLEQIKLKLNEIKLELSKALDEIRASLNDTLKQINQDMDEDVYIMKDLNYDSDFFKL